MSTANLEIQKQFQNLWTKSSVCEDVDRFVNQISSKA